MKSSPKIVLFAFHSEEGHYRRFIRREESTKELSSLGLKPKTVIEADNLAVFSGDNPVVIRIVARRV